VILDVFAGFIIICICILIGYAFSLAITFWFLSIPLFFLWLWVMAKRGQKRVHRPLDADEQRYHDENRAMNDMYKQARAREKARRR